ncbi:Do family serine endopeptidase [Luteimonas deserti]|uniref:Probable periplasmic serine endoprotease DegP-like n=1 Tax=Luteimonas deserti TaxID=2752306 RepID=A0A7Z0U0B3_9GAMM|nr:Do family serine endopeptidase [Luteimonas deserti]NYZ63098.1 Do family serine endopeptidase [Luteimonas deserti]
MKKSLLAVSLVAVLSAATTALVLPVATAQSGQATQADSATTVSSTPQAPLVSGLPDFTRLVERVGPAVVSIETTMGARQTRGQQMPDDAQIPEIFRRFFGPGFEFPGQPGAPGAPGAAPRGVSMGTGFLISADGYLLTNHHVIDGADEVKVRLSDRREFVATIVGSDAESDVAVLKIDATGLPMLRYGNATAVKPGQWAVAIGSPFGFEQSVTAGIVSAVQRSNPYANQRYVPFIQTDVPINRGNSGGPLLNVAGEVIGINSQIFSNSGGYMGVSFAIPIDVASNVAEQIKTTGSVQRGSLGVQVSNVTAEAAAGFSLPDTRGALVQEVLAGSPAQRAGIEPGDVIRAVDGTQINNSSELPPLVGSRAPGTRMKLQVFREGRTRDFDVTLTALDSPGASTPARAERPQSGAAAPATNALGLVGRDLDVAQRRQFGLEDGEGVLIANAGRGAAASAGIATGDVVLRVGRTPVGSAAALDRALRDVKPGDTVMLLVRGRGGATQYRAVTVPATGER